MARYEALAGRLHADPTFMFDSFLELYHAEAPNTWLSNSWMGVPIERCPFDLWMYQQLLTSVAPAVTIETGAGRGGVSLFLASVCELLGRGHVIAIEPGAPAHFPQHDRLTHLDSFPTDPQTSSDVRVLVADRTSPAGQDAASAGVMVLLNAGDSGADVGAELALYAPLVTPGSYLVIQGTHEGRNPMVPELLPGPMAAIEEFLAFNGDFSVDRACETHILTFNGGGYLRRSATSSDPPC